MEKIKSKILKELLINDAFVHYFLWPLILLSILLFVNLPQSLKLILLIFLGAVSIISFTFALYRIFNALHLARIGVEIIVKNFSVDHGLFGTELKYEYEYAGMKYNKKNSFRLFGFPIKNRQK